MRYTLTLNDAHDGLSTTCVFNEFPEDPEFLQLVLRTALDRLRAEANS